MVNLWCVFLDVGSTGILRILVSQGRPISIPAEPKTGISESFGLTLSEILASRWMSSSQFLAM